MQVDPDYFFDVAETVPIRQGDIIRTDDVDRRRSVGWAMVVTADCDIAQSKMGTAFTCLEIISAIDYVNNFWAADELQKLVAKFEPRAISLIHEADLKRDHNVSPLRPRDLELWLREDAPAEIVARLNFSESNRTECMHALAVLGLARNQEGRALTRLRAIWAILRRTKKDQDGAVANALKPAQMRSDYVFLPKLPGEREIGFVVLLRAVRSIAPERIFPSALALRIGGRASDFYRLGRLADFLRYSVTQQWAALYSRIGMTARFEAECGKAAQILIADQLGA